MINPEKGQRKEAQEKIQREEVIITIPQKGRLREYGTMLQLVSALINKGKVLSHLENINEKPIQDNSFYYLIGSIGLGETICEILDEICLSEETRVEISVETIKVEFLEAETEIVE